MFRTGLFLIVILSCPVPTSAFAEDIGTYSYTLYLTSGGEFARPSANFGTPIFSSPQNTGEFSRTSADFNRLSANFNKNSFTIAPDKNNSNFPRPLLPTASNKGEFSKPSFSISANKGDFSKPSFSIANRGEFSEPSFSIATKSRR